MTQPPMFWKSSCNALWVYPNLITASKTFAPIFQENNLIRVKYLEISFTFNRYLGQVEKRQQQPRSQEKFQHAGGGMYFKYLGRVECCYHRQVI